MEITTIKQCKTCEVFVSTKYAVNMYPFAYFCTLECTSYGKLV